MGAVLMISLADVAKRRRNVMKSTDPKIGPVDPNQRIDIWRGQYDFYDNNNNIIL